MGPWKNNRGECLQQEGKIIGIAYVVCPLFYTHKFFVVMGNIHDKTKAYCSSYRKTCKT